MKHAVVGSLTALLAGAGLALAQTGDIEYLPPPRSASAPARAGASDQAVAVMPVPPAGDPNSLYGPPPPMVQPVCGTQGAPFRWWIEGDYHLWWVKEDRFPSLLVSIPAGGTFGGPGTETVAGGNELDRSLRNGGGLNLGGWFTDYQGFGIEGGFFLMESSSKSFAIAGSGAPGSPILARPFFNVLTGSNDIAIVSFPGLVSGSASAETEGIQCDSGRFAGANLDFVVNICCDPSCRFDFLIGYRYLMLDDRFAMTTNAEAAAGILLPSGNISDTVTDRINTSNRFNGFDIGLRGQWFYDRWMVRGTAKVAFGATDESVDLSGQTSSITSTGVPITFGSGFLVRPSNAGHFTTEQFSIVPELDLKLAYMICDWMRVSVGYSFLYWSSVVRSGDQVDLNINPREVPALSPPTGFTNVTPTTVIHCSNFWAHGINVGLEVRF